MGDKNSHPEMQENDDGSVEILLDFNSKDSEKASTQDGFKLAEGGEEDEGHDEGQEDDSDDGDDGDEGREDLRAARREERKAKKERQRERAREDKHLIASMKRQLEEMSQRLAATENSTRGYQFAQLDKAIDDEKVRVQYAKMKIEEAVQAQDGAAMTDAQELLFEAKSKLNQLEHHKKNATQAAQRKPQAVPDARANKVKSLAGQWMERNDWYDPSLKDLDSKITRQIDEAMAEEGYDPADADYWEELDARLAKHLPHRFGKHVQSNPNRKKGPAVGGGARGAASEASAGGGKVQFRLSPERVSAIKAAGKWDDPKARQKMINQYADFDRRNSR